MKHRVEIDTRTTVTIDVHEGTLEEAITSMRISPAVLGGGFSYSAHGPCYNTENSSVEMLGWCKP